jgi:CheY-like chemotaxis protein
MRRRTILLIAPHPQEGQLIEQVFGQLSPPHTLRIVRDGEEALASLLREGASTDPRRTPPPDVIVLDLSLPWPRAQEVVQRLRQDARVKRLPIIVLASSGRAEDIGQAYAAGANAYVRKPAEMARLLGVIEQLGQFWLETVELPPDA